MLLFSITILCYTVLCYTHLWRIAWAACPGSEQAVECVSFIKKNLVTKILFLYLRHNKVGVTLRAALTNLHPSPEGCRILKRLISIFVQIIIVPVNSFGGQAFKSIFDSICS